jgi:hypothetical protein
MLDAEGFPLHHSNCSQAFNTSVQSEVDASDASAKGKMAHVI